MVPPPDEHPVRLMPATGDAARDDAAASPLRLAAIQDLLQAHRLDAAAGLALGALDRRAADGEEWAAAIAAVLRAYQGQVAALPPLSRVLPRPIRPDERAAQAFAGICSLLALQNAQLDELKATIAELI